MKNNSLQSWLAVAVVMFVAGCSLPTDYGPGPRVWIDNPLNGDTLALSPLVVQSHASSGSGTTYAALLVNGAQIRVDGATNPSDALTSFTQVWTPTVSGDYTLEVVATDSRGNTGRSNRVVVHISDSAYIATRTTEDISPLPIISPPPSILTITPSTTVSLIPTFIFTINANCRQGPGIDYELIMSFFTGDKATIDGRNDDSSWYWVLISNGLSHCWVSSSTGSPQGPLGSVVIVPVIPPVAPVSLSVNTKSCTSSEYKVTLMWSDVMNELGYRIYRDGVLIATLPFNSTIFDDVSPDYNPHSYRVQTYNDAGAADSPAQDSAGCLY